MWVGTHVWSLSCLGLMDCEHWVLCVSPLLLPICGCLHLGRKPDPEACQFAMQIYMASVTPEATGSRKTTDGELDSRKGDSCIHLLIILRFMSLWKSFRGSALPCLRASIA